MNATETKLTGGYGAEVLRAAFEKIQNPDDWKAPVDAEISHKCFSLAATAVEFFTGTALRVIGGPMPITGHILVHADGYRAGPCGDH